MRTAGRDEHVVDGLRLILEEPLERVHIGRVEGGRALRIDLAGGPLQALGIAADEDDVRALRAREPGCLEADAGAAAEQDDGLPGQLPAHVACEAC